MIRMRLYAGIALCLVSVVVLSAADKRPTGATDGNKYRDSLYGFVFEKYDNWKFGKVDNEDPAKPRATRCILTQKSVAVPTEYLENEDKFNVPAIGFFVDTSEMPLEAYAADLADRKSKRPSRKELTKDFSILGKGSFIDQGPITIDGQRAIAQHYRQDYEVQLYNRLKDQYSIKEDVMLGDLYLTKRGNTVYIIHLTCERAIYRTVNEEAKTIIMSVDFDPPVEDRSPTDSTAGADSGASGQ